MLLLLSIYASVCNTLRNLFRRHRYSERHKKVDLYASIAYVIQLDANCCVRMHFPTEMCPLLCATNQLTYANDAAIIASTNASLTKPTSMNHSMSISRDDTASPDAFVLVDVERRTRASSHRYVMCVFLARRRIQPHPSKRRIDAASKYRYTCLSLFAVDRCSGQYASCRCPSSCSILLLLQTRVLTSNSYQ